jgi:cobalamin biosynthesis Mg chelatase CobN
MMRRRRLLGAVGATTVLFGMAGPAVAGGPSIQAVPNTVVQGQTLTVFGQGFCGTPGCSTVTVDVDNTPVARDISTKADGSFSSSFTLNAIPGVRNLSANQDTATGQRLTATTQILVFISDTPPSSGEVGSSTTTAAPATSAASSRTRTPSSVTVPPAGSGPPTSAVTGPAAQDQTPAGRRIAMASQRNKSSSRTGPIVAIAIGAILVIALVAGVRWRLARR